MEKIEKTNKNTLKLKTDTEDSKSVNLLEIEMWNDGMAIFKIDGEAVMLDNAQQDLIYYFFVRNREYFKEQDS